MSKKRNTEHIDFNGVGIDIQQLASYVLSLHQKINSMERELKYVHRHHHLSSPALPQLSPWSFYDNFETNYFYPKSIQENITIHEIHNENNNFKIEVVRVPFHFYLSSLNNPNSKFDTNPKNKTENTFFENEKTALVNFLKSLNIKIIDKIKVFDYLDSFQDLIEPLKKICKQARALLGSDTRLALTWYRDPEINDNYLSLYFRNDQRYREISKIIPELKKFTSNIIRFSEGNILILKDLTTATLTEEELNQYNDNNLQLG
jgi:hypothetical protein